MGEAAWADQISGIYSQYDMRKAASTGKIRKNLPKLRIFFKKGIAKNWKKRYNATWTGFPEAPLVMRLFVLGG